MKQVFAIIFFTVLFDLCSSSLFAQHVYFTAGEKFTSKNGDFQYIIDEDKTYFYVLRTGKKGSGVQNNIEKYNKETMKLEWVKDASFESDLQARIPSDLQFLHSRVLLLKDKIYFILSMVETRKNLRSVYAKAISAETGESMSTAKLLAKQENYKDANPMEIIFSPDRQLLLIPNYDLARIQLIDVKTFQEIFTKKMPQGSTEDALSIWAVRTDDDGNLLCYYRNTDKERQRSGMGKIPVSSDKMIAVDLPLDVNDHAYLASHSTNYDKNFNYVYVTGFFTDIPCTKKEGENCIQKEGNFYMKLDLNKGKILNKQVDYFDDGLHTYYTRLFDVYNDHSRLNVITSVMSKTDELFVIARGDLKTIFVTHYSKDGKLIWRKPLSFEPFQGIGDFAWALKNDDLYIVYLEHPKNLEQDVTDFDPKKLKETQYPKKAVVVAVKIDKTGNVSREIIADNKEQDVKFDFYWTASRIYDNEIYHLREGDDEKFIKFELK
jgi:hypothetical protein